MRPERVSEKSTGLCSSETQVIQTFLHCNPLVSLPVEYSYNSCPFLGQLGGI